MFGELVVHLCRLREINQYNQYLTKNQSLAKVLAMKFGFLTWHQTLDIICAWLSSLFSLFPTRRLLGVNRSVVWLLCAAVYFIWFWCARFAHLSHSPLFFFFFAAVVLNYCWKDSDLQLKLSAPMQKKSGLDLTLSVEPWLISFGNAPEREVEERGEGLGLEWEKQREQGSGHDSCMRTRCPVYVCVCMYVCLRGFL